MVTEQVRNLILERDDVIAERRKAADRMDMGEFTTLSGRLRGLNESLGLNHKRQLSANKI